MVALRRILRMVSTGTGMLRMRPQVLSLQARCTGRTFAFRLSAAVLDAGMQPRRTAGENELPKDQQRRQNLKAGLKHALRATRKRELSARPVAMIVPDRADKSIVHRDLNRKLPLLSGIGHRCEAFFPIRNMDLIAAGEDAASSHRTACAVPLQNTSRR